MRYKKGVKISTGDLIMFMMISDGYLDSTWISQCVKLLETHSQTSLCCGLPQYMSEVGVLGKVSYKYWLGRTAPSDVTIFEHWLATGWHFPECNMCIRRPVVERLFSTIDKLDESIDVFLEFTYRFHTAGFLSRLIPTVANFGRLHSGQRVETEQNRAYFANAKQHIVFRETLLLRMFSLEGLGLHLGQVTDLKLKYITHLFLRFVHS